MSRNARSLFTESMNWMDDYYDSEAGYLFDFSATSALNHNTRSSVWYALGLLARNKGDDAKEAEKIITNVIHAQYEDPKDEWYGTYQKEPEEPYVGSSHYPAKIYNSWDPNWRGFVGTTLIMAMEEYSAIISKSTQKLILQSLYNTTKGDEYRFGNTDNTKDNLYPAYSNPSIMRAFVSGWTGRRLHEKNMTTSGEKYAQDIIDLFNRADTLSEFNSGTYTGVSLFGLLLWSKYLPEDSPQIMSHMADYAWGPLFAILADHHKSLIPKKVLSGLKKFSGEHTFEASAYYPPFDKVPRNITTWLSDKLTIGAESFDEIAIGGPSQNQEAFNPAVVQWDTGKEISFISLYPTETALQTKVGPGQLTLSYPNGNSGSIFSLLVGTFKSKRTISGWEDIVGLKVAVSGNVNTTYGLSFGGQYGGSDSPIRDFEFWNFTYTMPAGFAGTPSLTLDLEIS
ncbi:hypothetical protein CEP53_013610 [Fusarium sp. AF-6]|nr:hypothetical protein CEP53_013610 [Fusarium sp. AF-6]